MHDRTTASPPSRPYKGLEAFAEEDAALFYGRQRETRIVTSNARAARLTVLYAPGGVGKSSLVRAGVAALLHQADGQAAVVVDTWTGDPVTRLKSAMLDELWRINLPVPADLANLSLDEFILRAAAFSPAAVPLRTPIVIVLDQFEDYFLFGPTGDRAQSFEEQLARSINRRECPLHVLIVLREDALARLDRFSGRVPSLFNNYLRIEPLDGRAAVEAITKPLDVYNGQHPGQDPVRIEDELVARVVLEVRAGQRLAVQTGRETQTPADETRAATDRVYVEAPYLQLVLTTMWDAEMRAGSRVLRATTLTALGGAQRILKTHIDTQMRKLTPDQREIAARVFRFLVSPSGTLNAFLASDLADYGEVPLAEVTPVLEHLAAGDVRILRRVASDSVDVGPRYEVFFEVLAAAALSWRARYISLPTYSWAALGPALVLLGLGVVTEVARAANVIQTGNLLLLVTRGATLLVLSSLMLVQIYRWFLRFVSISGFLSIRTYRSPVIGAVLAVLLSALCYVSTGIRIGTQQVVWDPFWLATVSTTDFVRYVVIVLLTWAIGALGFAAMQFAGQFTAQRFRTFDVGLYSVFWVITVVLAGLIVVIAITNPQQRPIVFAKQG